jgi:hypothetical protein
MSIDFEKLDKLRNDDDAGEHREHDPGTDIWELFAKC